MSGLSLSFLVLAVVGPMRPASGPAESVRADFLLTHPCPATDKFSGDCKGWRVDLIVPTCAGGELRVSNLHWLSTDAASLRQREAKWPCIKGASN